MQEVRLTMSSGFTRTGGVNASSRPARKNRIQPCALTLGAALLSLSSGCTMLKDTSGDALAPGATLDRIVSDDIAVILEQILEPRSTTVQINRDRADSFTEKLAARLTDQGFGIQRVAADQGAHYVEHQRDIVLPTSGGARVTERLTIGTIETQRESTITRNVTVRSAGPLRIAGGRISLDAEMLSKPPLQIADPTHRVIEYVNDPAVEPAGEPVREPSFAPSFKPVGEPAGPLERIVTPAVVERVAFDNREGIDLQSLIGSQGIPLSEADATTEVNNLFYGTSAFESELDGLERVERQIIVFPNDSMQLGKANKRLVARLARGSIQQDDRISLVGCSTGYTSLSIGNEGLAIGRAQRVIEELTDHDIPRQQIFDEGCWAPVSAGEDFPGRGVVIDIWRHPA